MNYIQIKALEIGSQDIVCVVVDTHISHYTERQCLT